MRREDTDTSFQEFFDSSLPVSVAYSTNITTWLSIEDLDKKWQAYRNTKSLVPCGLKDHPLKATIYVPLSWFYYPELLSVCMSYD